MEVERKYHIDILRILACFAVIVNHFTPGFAAFNSENIARGGAAYWLLAFLSESCKFAVPLFFMISGALLLKKEEPIKVLLKKRVLRIVISLLVFSVIYVFFNRHVLGINRSFSDIYSSEAMYHLWYLYAYIAFLLCLPILRDVARQINREKMIYCTTIFFIFFCIIPVVELLLFNNRIHLNSYLYGMFICSTSFFAPLLGYYIEHKLNIDKIKSCHLWFVVGINLLMSIIAMYCMSLTNTNGETLNESQIATFSTIHAASIFVIAKVLLRKYQPKKLKALLLSVSSCTFGIYLIHLFPMWYVMINERAMSFYRRQHFAVEIAIWFGFSGGVFVGCYCVIWILKKIPIIKNIF